MRVSRILTTMIGVLLVVSVCFAADDTGSTEVRPKFCPDLSHCQIIEDDGPVPQSNESLSFKTGMRILDWLSSFLLVPMIGA